METIDPVTIEKNTESDPSLDFAVLRKQSIELLQKLSGKTWTDFNLHDPGITILEQLCYAITDLVYRTNFPIEDILTNLHGKINTQDHAFFSREKILTTNPVTVNDFRKVILDEVEEVANVQLEPIKSTYSDDYIKGLYRILIQVNQSTIRKFEDPQFPTLEQEIIEKVKHAFLNHRNLSEDMVRQIVVLKPKKINICAKIIIGEQTLPEELLAEIYHRLELLLCPVIKRFTEKELLNQGMTIEQIYSGPLLKNGMIPDSELKPLKKEIDPIEILEEITKIEGVLYVKDLSVGLDNHGPHGKPIELLPDEFPLLEIIFSDRGINLYNDDYKFDIKENIFKTIYSKFTQPTYVHKKTEIKIPDTYITRGAFRDVNHYHSIQHYFPVTYGIGEEGLSANEPELRKAQAKQLKTYLLFYEQILADYLAQLANIHRLFSADIDERNTQTYFHQTLYEVPGIEDLLKPFADTLPLDKKREWEIFKQKQVNTYTEYLKTSKEATTVYQERKNQMLDHLLARFNQRVSAYPVVLYNSVYGNSSEGERNYTLLNWKADILKNTVANTYNRIKAFNYANDHENTSGFEKKMFTLLHITNKKNRVLSDVFDSKNIFFSTKEEYPTPQSPSDQVFSLNEDDPIDPDLFITTAELNKLISKDLYAWEAYKNTNFVFRDQTVTLLKHGLEIKNYKIGPERDQEDSYLIIYKEPDKTKWVTISRHQGKMEAVKALFKLIEFIKKLSTGAEGFHIIEHLLLRPDIKNDVFGFQFYHYKNTVSFKNEQFTSFEKREDIISKVIDHAAAQTKDKPLKNLQTGSPIKIRLHNTHDFQSIKIEDLSDETKYPSDKEFNNLMSGLHLFKEKKTKFFPQFQLTVRLSDGTILKEDFFNFKITVVLPSWPARFQDKEFRNFVKDLFLVNAPVYLQINLIWMDIAPMMEFENIYFKWLEALKNKESNHRLNEFSEELIHLIKKESFHVH